MRLDGGTQTRAQLDQDAVKEYAEIMVGKSDRTLPPIILYEDEAHVLWLADGFHRVNAALKNRQTEIAAEVRLGTRLDALLHSLRANQTHGVRRTNADKRRSVEVALGEETLRERSSRDIAKLCGVGHQLVDMVRREQEGNAAFQVDDSSTSKAVAKRIGADGKMHPVSRPKPAKKTAPQVSEALTPEEQTQANGAVEIRIVSDDARKEDSGTGEVNSSVSDNRKDHEDKCAKAGTEINAPLRGVVVDTHDAEHVPGEASSESSPLQTPGMGTLTQVTQETLTSELPGETSASQEAEGFLGVDGTRLPHNRWDEGPISFEWVQTEISTLKWNNDNATDKLKRSPASLKAEQNFLIELARTANRVLSTTEEASEPLMEILNGAVFRLRNCTNQLSRRK